MHKKKINRKYLFTVMFLMLSSVFLWLFFKKERACMVHIRAGVLWYRKCGSV